MKTARKGIGRYGLKVEGVAAHAGVDFAAGASAVLEMARQVETISGFTDLQRGVTVNVGVVRGGTRSNVIASEAEAEIDVRVPTLRDFKKLAGQLGKLKAADKRCRLVASLDRCGAAGEAGDRTGKGDGGGCGGVVDGRRLGR